MVQSDFFGRTFWFGKDNQLKSAPTNIDNTVDYNSFDYVCDWTDWEGVNYYELFDIVSELVGQKVNTVKANAWQNSHQHNALNWLNSMWS